MIGTRSVEKQVLAKYLRPEQLVIDLVNVERDPPPGRIGALRGHLLVDRGQGAETRAYPRRRSCTSLQGFWIDRSQTTASFDTSFVPCGIEVSSRTLLVELGGRGAVEFPNTPSGHQAVLRHLARARGSVRVCLESIGLYGLDLALVLHQARIELRVAHPRLVRHFAQALRQRGKTDQPEARVLREYAARMPFVPWRPPSRAALKLVAVARRLHVLTTSMAAEKNRRHAASLSHALPPLIRLDLARSICTQQRPDASGPHPRR